MEKSMRQLLKRVLPALVVLLPAALVAQDMNSPIPFDPNVRTGKLPNGMTYYIRHNAKPEKRVELRLAVNAGAMEENDDQQGLAHFNEHMAFNGTKHFQRNDLINFLESAGVKFGADLNAYTSFDETVFMLQVPTDSEKILSNAMLVLEDWAHNLAFDSVEIDKERGVVISERRLGLGAFERMREKYWPIMFKDSRYALRLPIGKLDILENCKHSTLKQFYLDWYRPDLMAIVVVGDIDVDKMEKKIKEEFSPIPAKVNPRPRIDYPVPDTKDLLVCEATDKEMPYNMIQIIYKHDKVYTKTLADYKKAIALNLYNAMLNNRLKELQQQANPPFLFSYVNIGAEVRTKDAYTSFGIVPSGGVTHGVEVLLEQNEKVKRFGFTATELDRTKKDIMRQLETQLAEMDKTESKEYVQEYVSNFLEQEPSPGIKYDYDFFKKYMPDVTLDDVNSVAKNYITDNGKNAVIVIQAPQKDSATLPSEDTIRKIFNGIQNMKLTAYVDKVSDKPLMATKPTPGKVVSEKQIKEFGVTEWTLSNGVKVVLKPTDFKNDEVVFDAYRWGGTSLVSDKDFESAAKAGDIENVSGIGEFGPTQLDKMLTGKVVEVRPTLGELSEGFTGSFSPKDMETAFQLVNLYYTSPRKDDTAYQAFMDQQRGFIQNQSVEPNVAFGDTVGVTMSQYHFRRRPVTEAILGEVNENAAFEAYKQAFSDGNGFTFFFVGNFTLDQIKPFVETYLGGLPSKSPTPMWKDQNITRPTGTLTKTVYRGKEPKSTVAMIYTGPFEFNRKNRLGLEALSQLLSIKLREQLREEMSGVYGVFAQGSPSHYPKQQYQFTVYFGCAPERVDELTNAALKEIDSVRHFGASDINLNKIKETLKRQRQVDLKDNKFWLTTLTQNDMNNENLLDLQNFDKDVDAISSDYLKALANQYLDGKNYAKFMLMPEKQ
jgi:zinc protease